MAMLFSSTESHEEDNGGWSSFVSMRRVLPAYSRVWRSSVAGPDGAPRGQVCSVTVRVWLSGFPALTVSGLVQSSCPPGAGAVAEDTRTKGWALSHSVTNADGGLGSAEACGVLTHCCSPGPPTAGPSPEALLMWSTLALK